MTNIASIRAREILDSRGNPTIEADVILDSGLLGRASVPSGASVGSKEALELRDNDSKRYHGKGVLKAIKAIHHTIAPALHGQDVTQQKTIDHGLIALDGTQHKTRLGANALLAVSLACAKAAALSKGLPLYAYLGGEEATLLPLPQMNILNGGVHADNHLVFQECMIVPHTAKSFPEALRMGHEVFYALRSRLKSLGLGTNVGDEGGFAPNITSIQQALDLIMESIVQVGFIPGMEIGLAIDAAASEFYENGHYHVGGVYAPLASDHMINFYSKLIANYPILSIEDAMSEHDHMGWRDITTSLGKKVQLVGDDLFVTNPAILSRGIKDGLANAILIKMNQIGTLTETLDTIALAKAHHYRTIISHRSGETEDCSLAHLAVACNAGQIKTGSLCRTDRIGKYNELLRIHEALGSRASFAAWDPLS